MSIDVTIKYAVATNKSSLDVVRQLINGEGDFTPSTSLVEFQNEAKQRPVYIESIVAILHNVTWPLHQFHHFRAAGDMLLTHDSATYVTVSCSDEVVEKQAEDMLRRVLLPSTEKLDNSGRTPKIEKTETEKLEEERLRRWQRETDALELTLRELQAVLIYMTDKRVEIIRWAHFFMSGIENDFGEDRLVKEPKHLLSEQEIEKMAMELRWFSFPELLDTTRHYLIDVKEMRTLTNDLDLSESFVDLLSVIEKKQADELKMMKDLYNESDIYKQSVTLVIYNRQIARHRIYGHYCRLLLLCLNRIWSRLHVKIVIPIHEQVKRLLSDVQTYQKTHDTRQIEGHLKLMDGLLISIFDKFDPVMDALWKLIGSIDNLRVFGESDIYVKASTMHLEATSTVREYRVSSTKASVDIMHLKANILKSEHNLQQDDLKLIKVQEEIEQLQEQYGKKLGLAEQSDLHEKLADITKEIVDIRSSLHEESQKIVESTDKLLKLEREFTIFIRGVKKLLNITEEKSVVEILQLAKNMLITSEVKPFQKSLLKENKKEKIAALNAKARELSDKITKIYEAQLQWKKLFQNDIDYIKKTVDMANELIHMSGNAKLSEALRIMQNKVEFLKKGKSPDISLINTLQDRIEKSKMAVTRIGENASQPIYFLTFEKNLRMERETLQGELAKIQMAIEEEEQKQEEEREILQGQLIEIQMATKEKEQEEQEEKQEQEEEERKEEQEEQKVLTLPETYGIDDPFEQIWNQ